MITGSLYPLVRSSYLIGRFILPRLLYCGCNCQSYCHSNKDLQRYHWELQQSNTLRENPVDPILIETIISDKIKASIWRKTMTVFAWRTVFNVYIQMRIGLLTLPGYPSPTCIISAHCSLIYWWYYRPSGRCLNARITSASLVINTVDIKWKKYPIFQVI